MTSRTRFAPPNSIVVIEDAAGGGVPKTISPGSIIAFTDSCIAVGCRSEVDGDTEFVLGPAAEVDPGYRPVFEGNLTTPSRKVVLKSIFDEVMLQEVVRCSKSSVRIWANDQTEPDMVIVGII